MYDGLTLWVHAHAHARRFDDARLTSVVSISASRAVLAVPVCASLRARCRACMCALQCRRRRCTLHVVLVRAIRRTLRCVCVRVRGRMRCMLHIACSRVTVLHPTISANQHRALGRDSSTRCEIHEHIVLLGVLHVAFCNGRTDHNRRVHLLTIPASQPARRASVPTTPSEFSGRNRPRTIESARTSHFRPTRSAALRNTAARSSKGHLRKACAPRAISGGESPLRSPRHSTLTIPALPERVRSQWRP
jgi:hypothetical protein